MQAIRFGPLSNSNDRSCWLSPRTHRRHGRHACRKESGKLTKHPVGPWQTRSMPFLELVTIVVDRYDLAIEFFWVPSG